MPQYLLLAGVALCATAPAQIPDLMNALDAGGRAMGIGGGSAVTDGNTLSALANPAGLAYIASPTLGVNFRNLPKSLNTISGQLNDPDYATRATAGKFALTHFGYALPAFGGTVGLSYTVTGYLHDTTTGTNLQNGVLQARNLARQTRAQTDMFAISYGRKGKGLNWGAGIVFANQYINGREVYQLFDAGNNQVGNVDSTSNGNATGIGMVVGVQGTDAKNPNTSWGLSIRTPIDLSNNANTQAYYDRIPGKLSFGFASRAMAAGQDFWVYALQGDYYFGGQENKIIPRKNHLAFGGGVEYNFHRFGGRIPVRFGLSAVPSGGAGFDDRTTFTLGIGYRPNSMPLTIDFNFAKPTGKGPFDMAVGITYRSTK